MGELAAARAVVVKVERAEMVGAEVAAAEVAEAVEGETQEVAVLREEPVAEREWRTVVGVKAVG